VAIRATKRKIKNDWRAAASDLLKRLLVTWSVATGIEFKSNRTFQLNKSKSYKNLTANFAPAALPAHIHRRTCDAARRQWWEESRERQWKRARDTRVRRGLQEEPINKRLRPTENFTSRLAAQQCAPGTQRSWAAGLADPATHTNQRLNLGA